LVKQVIRVLVIMVRVVVLGQQHVFDSTNQVLGLKPIVPAVALLVVVRQVAQVARVVLEAEAVVEAVVVPVPPAPVLVAV
jgi:hypothetical protein